MPVAIELVISLLLIILFYSLLATVVMELLSGVFALRAKHLFKTLGVILSGKDKNDPVFTKFLQHPLYQQLAGKAYGKHTPPSYIEAGDFRSILLKVIADLREGDWRTKLEQLPDENLRTLLLQYYEEASEEWTLFSQRIENWYDDVMDRASGWYKRKVHLILLILGFFIAVAFNVDILTVYRNLVNASGAELGELVQLAEQVSANDTQPANRALYSVLEQNIKQLEEPLGIGWQELSTYPQEGMFWVWKFLGWALMAVCISKGAPFWFELLKKAVNFRATGDVPPLIQQIPVAVAPPPPAEPRAALPAPATATSNPIVDPDPDHPVG